MFRVIYCNNNGETIYDECFESEAEADDAFEVLRATNRGSCVRDVRSIRMADTSIPAPDQTVRQRTVQGVNPTKRDIFGNNAGWRDARRNTLTGGWTSVYHSEEMGLEGEDRWTVLCETHSTFVSIRTMRDALIVATDPTSFCEDCRVVEAE